MYKYIFLLPLLLSGCTSYRYESFSQPSFSDSVVERIPISIHFVAVKNSFIKELKKALLKKGFSSIRSGLQPKGYSIAIESIVNEVGLNSSAIPYMLSLSLFPANKDVIETFHLTFYKDGIIQRSTTYKSETTLFISAFFPTPLFIGDSAEETHRKTAERLANNIVQDYSKTQ